MSHIGDKQNGKIFTTCENCGDADWFDLDVLPQHETCPTRPSHSNPVGEAATTVAKPKAKGKKGA